MAVCTYKLNKQDVCIPPSCISKPLGLDCVNSLKVYVMSWQKASRISTVEQYVCTSTVDWSTPVLHKTLAGYTCLLHLA